MSLGNLILEPTSYDHIGLGPPIQSKNVKGSVLVELTFRACDLVNEGASLFQLETKLESVVRNFDEVIPKGVNPQAKAYVSRVECTGTSNDSPFTFFGGLSELTKRTLRYINDHQPNAIAPEHVERLKTREPVYNFEVPTTTHLFEEGHPARIALEKISDDGEVYEHSTKEIQSVTPHARAFSLAIATYKGVTAGSLDRTEFVDKADVNYVRVPTKSLIASHITPSFHKFFYAGDGAFSRNQDMFIVMQRSQAKQIKGEILEQARRVQEACVCNVREILFNIKLESRGDWYFDQEQSLIINRCTGQTYTQDHKFNVRMTLKFNTCFVAYTDKSVALSYNGGPIDYPKVYSLKSLVPSGRIHDASKPLTCKQLKNGHLQKDAKPIYEFDTAKVISASNPDPSASSTQAKRRRRQDQEHPVSEESTSSSSSSHAASSAPIVEDDDNV